MLKRGELKAVKVGRQWRFWSNEIEDYLKTRQFRFWTGSIGHLFFRPKVLDKYRGLSQSTQPYYLIEQANDGWVGSRQDKYDQQVLKSAKKRLPAGYLPFVDVHFRKGRLKDGTAVILLTPKQFQNLPNIEQKHWQSFLIKI